MTMKCHPFATVAIAAMAATAVSASTSHQRNAFVKAMSESHGSLRLAKDQTPSPKTLAEEMSGDSKRARELRKKIMSKAKLVRSLQEVQEEAAGEDASAVVADGTDDYYHAVGEWDNAFKFDATQYSLSYHRCAAVKQVDDTLAAAEDSTTVFITKNFAVFRFCPSMLCESSNVAENEDGDEAEVVGGANGDGCQSNYGEYMIELGDYLAFMVSRCGILIQSSVFSLLRFSTMQHGTSNLNIFFLPPSLSLALSLSLPPSLFLQGGVPRRTL
jgi:hypothetical protein